MGSALRRLRGRERVRRLWIVGAEGGAELVNYRVRGRYMVVDRPFAAAELRLGGKRQDRGGIVRADAKARS